MRTLIKDSWKPVALFVGSLTLAVLLGLAMSMVGCGKSPRDVASNQELQTPPAARPDAGTPAAQPTGEVPPSPLNPAADPGANSATTEMGSVDRATAAEPAPTPAPVTYEDCLALYRGGHYDAAAEHFEAFLEEHPDNPWARYMLGISCWKAGRTEDAEGALRASVEKDPDFVKGRINLARLLLDAGRAKEARSEAEKAAKLDPRSSEAQNVLGRAYHSLNRNEEAVHAYRRAAALDPGNAWAMNNLGLILIQEGKAGDALPPLARAVELRSDVATFQNNLGIALERTGHMPAAAEAYRAAVDADASHERASANLARVANLPDAPGATEVDLAALARRFQTELTTGSLAEASTSSGAVSDTTTP
jgi:predicted Zn-dependent protease